MAGYLMQPPTLGEVIVDIGQQVLHHRRRIRCEIIAPQRVRPDQDRGRVVIGRPPEHHPIKPEVQQRFCLRQRGHPAIEANHQLRKRPLHAEHQIIIQRRHFAVFLRRQTLQPRLARMDDEVRNPGLGDHLQKPGQRRARLLIIHPDPAFHRYRHISLADHRGHTFGHQRRPLHQHRAKAPRLHPVGRTAAVEVDLVKPVRCRSFDRRRQTGRV